MYKKEQLRNTVIMVGTVGADLVCFESDKKAQEKFKLGLTPGIHQAEEILVYMDDNDVLHLHGEATVMRKGGKRLKREKLYDQIESGANADWTPTSAEAQAQIMEARTARIARQAAEKAIMAAEKATTKRVERMQQQQSQVVEPDDEHTQETEVDEQQAAEE